MTILALAVPAIITQAVARPIENSTMQDSAAVMIAGELWDSFLPPNAGFYYSETGQQIWSTFLRIGNFDRRWSTPTHMWPGGWPYGMFWGKGMYLTEFNPDSSWNPPSISGNPNPAYHSEAGSRYAFASYNNSVLGSSNPTRNYIKGTQWADSVKRHHVMYEAGWPTNVGVDVKIKIHQFTLNWNNINDCILVEITLTNSGVLDLNADGIADSIQTGRSGGNAIRALTLMAHGEVFGSYVLGADGGRGSRLGSTRAIGYIGDNDPTGLPWDMVVAFPGESVTGTQDVGYNDGVNKYYTDVWSSWAWIAAKSGASLSGAEHLLPDKTTIYGTNAIGSGPQRGWYSSAGQGRGLAHNGLGAGGSLQNPLRIHTAAMGTWYNDGGKSRDSTKLDLSPDPNFFLSGTPGDPTTFVPKAVPARPRGDRKLMSNLTYNPAAFEVNPYEPGWQKGFTSQDNFDGDLFDGLGPFSLGVGESITIVWAEAGGYRMQGVQNAIAAARWLFEHGYQAPEVPAVPMMSMRGTPRKTARILWDQRAEGFSGFGGYKIWRVFRKDPVDWLSGGMRGLDEAWRATVPGLAPDSLLGPINPYFKPQTTSTTRPGEPGSWGPYELVAVIPQSQLSSYVMDSSPPFSYAWEDRRVALGMEYWYYVSAYATGSFDMGPGYSGTHSPTTSLLETSNVNRNGATGFWGGAYPFANLSASFPKTQEGRSAIGAPFTVTTPAANPAAVANGAVKIGVRPNPYKRLAFWDNPLDPISHQMVFYNLPQQCTITILDVSGQIIDQIRHTATDPQSSTHSWNMFSKNGIEVASGLYIYVVEYEGGRFVGYFSILR